MAPAPSGSTAAFLQHLDWDWAPFQGLQGTGRRRWGWRALPNTAPTPNLPTQYVRSAEAHSTEHRAHGTLPHRETSCSSQARLASAGHSQSSMLPSGSRVSEVHGAQMQHPSDHHFPFGTLRHVRLARLRCTNFQRSYDSDFACGFPASHR